MLVRDSRNTDALQLFEAGYRDGRRDPIIVLELYRLLMSFAEIERATQVIEDFVSSRSNDSEAITLLARHYADTQNRAGEIRSLERLFELTLSPNIARDLLALYRIAGSFGDEEKFLRRLLPTSVIAAPEAERLGLMLASRGDLVGAREALARFDEIASPELVLGRFALFDMLVKTGEADTALTKAVSWIAQWHFIGIDRDVTGDASTARLVQMMMAVDVNATRTLLCDINYQLSLVAEDRVRGALCAMANADAVGVGFAAASGGRRRAGTIRNE
jgi:tetratricopeptide (TPR) repeat protein